MQCYDTPFQIELCHFADAPIHSSALNKQDQEFRLHQAVLHYETKGNLIRQYSTEAEMNTNAVGKL